MLESCFSVAEQFGVAFPTCSNLPKEWVRRLLQLLTNMRYLYVFIDEVGSLERFRDHIGAKYSEEINGNSKL